MSKARSEKTGIQYRFEDYSIDLVREEDGSFLASVSELPGCLAAGDDANEAVEMLRDSFELWVADAAETGRPVPQPTEQVDVSGRVLVRMSKSVHARAAAEARRQGVSLNAFIVSAMATALGRAEVQDALEQAVEAKLTEMLGAVSVRQRQLVVEVHGPGSLAPTGNVLRYFADEAAYNMLDWAPPTAWMGPGSAATMRGGRKKKVPGKRAAANV